MSDISIEVVGDEAVNTRLSNLRRYVVTAIGAPASYFVSVEAIAAAVEKAKELFKTPASGPTYPLRWKSDKQRKYVMAKLRSEGNLPYRRTGAFAKAWESEIKGNSISIANTATEKGTFIAPFIIGSFQQPFHSDTGWQKRSEPIERRVIKPITDDIEKRTLAGIEASKSGRI